MPKRPIRQSTLAKMSNEQLRSTGYIRIPGFTRKDGTKVKAHIRELKPSEKKQESSDGDSGWMESLSSFSKKVMKTVDETVDAVKKEVKEQIKSISDQGKKLSESFVEKTYKEISSSIESSKEKAFEEIKKLASTDLDSARKFVEKTYKKLTSDVKVSKKRFSMDDHLAKYSNPKSRLDAARREIKNSTHDENSKESFLDSWKKSFDTKQSPAAERIALRKEATKQGVRLTTYDLKAIQSGTMTMAQAIKRRKEIRKVFGNRT